ncbi:MAG TPA: chemotaxis protein CheW [Geobacteraceae bacterium]|nr:chemotaxis protein CheW [Geobacteraceae bacterium]
MSGKARRFLIFTLHDKRYALNVEDLSEVMVTPTTFPIPKAPEIFLGVMNFHGSPTPVLDLTTFLHGNPPNGGGSVLILDHKIGSLAIRIDTVERIVSDIRGLQVRQDSGPYRRQSILFNEETIPILAMDLVMTELEERMRTGRGNGSGSRKAKAG